MKTRFYLFPVLACLLYVWTGADKVLAQQKVMGMVFNEKAEPVGEVLVSVGQSEFIKTNRNGSFQVSPKLTKQRYEPSDFKVAGYRVKRLEGTTSYNVHVTPATQIRGYVVDKLKRKKRFRVLLQDENEAEETTTQADGAFLLNNISKQLLANPTQNLKFWVDGEQVDAQHMKFQDNGTIVLLTVPNNAKPELEPEIDLTELKNASKPDNKKEVNASPTKTDFEQEFNKITENLLDDRQEYQRRARRLHDEIVRLAQKLRNADHLPSREREELLKYMVLLRETFSDNDSLFAIYQAESKAEIAKMQRIIQEKDSLKTAAERKTERVEKEKDRIEAEKRYNELQFQTRLYIFSIVLGVLLLLVFVFFFYNRIFKRQRDQLRIIGEALEIKIQEANQQKEEILSQRDDLEKKSKQLEYAYGQITSSIVSAERIQKAILDTPEKLLERFADGFVIYYPRDIVSGDFYWCTERDQMTILGVIDCTGHGVPGAFMTMLGHSLLNYIINERGIAYPNEVLTVLDRQVQQALHLNNGEENYVGMDMALLCFDYNEQIVHFAGAKHYVLRAHEGTLDEIKGAKYPIGITKFKADYNFEEQTFPLVSGDCFYLQSDGFPDQITEIEGKRKKMTKKRYLDVVAQHTHLPFHEQKAALVAFFEHWRNENPQTDDITVVGIQVK